MTNDLATPADLAHLPGAPFTTAEVDAAVATLRSAVGWHVAPVSEDSVTATLDVGFQEPWLRLPTRKLVSVDEIRLTVDDSVVDPDDYRVSLELGVIQRVCGYWPRGFGTVEVDYTHGYESTPLDLLPVLAAMVAATRRTHSVQAQQDAVSNPDLLYGESDNVLGVKEAMQRYSLQYCYPWLV